MNLLAEYGLFLAKIVTVVVAIAIVIALIANLTQRKKAQRGELRVTRLGEEYKEMKEEVAAALLDPHQHKQWHKNQKKKNKQEAKAAKARAKRGDAAPAGKPTLYVLDFKGSIDAHEVSALREEVTAVLAVAKPADEVLGRLESPGGGVHGYGVSPAQLQSLRGGPIPPAIAVDKSAPTGGGIYG
ncbi:protease SohB, partial [Cronobacter sakazakii]